ncbi:9034_t:CDS:2, partial [Cetraspora pellucida]
LKPDRTLATQCLFGCKVNKKCLTIAFCANIDGLHKLKPLIIKKSKKPHCFKNIKVKNLGIEYNNSAKAWMITSIFQDWIKNFDHQVGLKHHGQCVLLLLDNCSSYDIDKDFHQTTDSVLNDIVNTIETLDLSNPMQVKEFLEIPDENIIYKVPLDDEVIKVLVETFRTDNPTTANMKNVEDEDNSFEIPVVSTNTANASLETIRIFLLQQDNTEEHINILEKIKKFINKTK